MEPAEDRGNESETLHEVTSVGVLDGGIVEIVDNKPVFKPTRGFLLAFGSLCMLSLAVSFDATSLSVALPIISTTLKGSALAAFWSGTSFLLASTVLQPTVASLSNIFGRKYVCFRSSPCRGETRAFISYSQH